MIIFPTISVTGCVTGFQWMSHVAMAVFCVLCMIFDCVFANQYMIREGLKYDLRNFKNGKIDREGRCKFMFAVFLECVFEMLMTQVAMFDIYVDVAFANLASYQGMTTLCALSSLSLGFIAIPKLYALTLSLILMFNCG